MATTDDTFDPNDLDSIDALLDEAELDAALEDPALPDESDLSGSALDDLLDEAELDSETDDLLDSLDDMPEVKADVETEVVAVSTPEISKAPEPAKAAISESDADDFLAKRAAARSNQNTQMTADEMGSIKKLIIIFGSILIVLVLTAIGMGVWSALAASSAGMDEETLTLIESIKVSSEHNGSELASSAKTVKSVEKKLDALNFQLEQLATDLADASTAGRKETLIDPLGLGGHSAPMAHDKPSTAHGQAHDTLGNTHAPAVKPVHSAPVSQVSSTVVGSDPAVLKKVSSINSKMIKAQRRIDEVNRRVKNIQTQYQLLLQSMKIIEKQALMAQVEQAKKSEKSKQSKAVLETNRYQYSAPDGVFYDQSVGDSYP
ncbi:MAG: hypothetical protein GXO35_02035 [Gammaproteobacteria bacterium]|nr:hypothetical protein [Gammaproteobacteria bacterium]